MGTFLEINELDVVRSHKLIRWIDPKAIKYLAKHEFRIDSLAEHVTDGDWDQELKLFNDGEVYKAVEDVFIHGTPWNETDFYVSGRLQKYEIKCEQDRAYYKKARCEYLNYLFNTMRTHGYAQDPNADYVGTSIGRNGEVILNNGRHRVAIAKLLSIPSIPVTIDVRHKDWTDFFTKVIEYADRHNEMVYAPIKHFDFSYIPSRQKDRSSLILKNMSPKSQTMVDLGANWGLMCSNLEPYFVKVTAVEKNPEEFYFLEKFKKAYNGVYETVNEDMVDFIKKQPKWDCVLMMSVLHHVPAERRDELLRAIDAKEMFFQFPSKHELELNIYDWIEMIFNSSCFNNVERLNPNGDREIFHFTR